MITPDPRVYEPVRYEMLGAKEYHAVTFKEFITVRNGTKPGGDTSLAKARKGMVKVIVNIYCHTYIILFVKQGK